MTLWAAPIRPLMETCVHIPHWFVENENNVVLGTVLAATFLSCAGVIWSKLSHGTPKRRNRLKVRYFSIDVGEDEGSK
jgi:hypothetical protein